MFETLNSQNRYAVLYRIETAKRPETRQRRIEKYVAMLARGETIYDHQGSRAAASVAHRGASHSTGAATSAVAPSASAATPIESSA